MGTYKFVYNIQVRISWT